MRRFTVTTVVHFEGELHVEGEYHGGHPTDIVLEPGETIALGSNLSDELITITGTSPETTLLAPKKQKG